MCKYFIEAIESQKYVTSLNGRQAGPDHDLCRYGWFWNCPNGENCMYRHALPPGFVLKAQKKAMDEAERANQISIEEFLEVEVRLRRPFRLRLCLCS